MIKSLRNFGIDVPEEISFGEFDPSKAQKELGWRHTTSFQDLVREMIEVDRAAVAREHNSGPGER